MIDENAYGLWIAPYDPENLEYGQSREEFVTCLRDFEGAVAAQLAEQPLGPARLLVFGVGIYLELAAGDELMSPFAWLKQLRERLALSELVTLAALTYGGRWVTEPGDPASPLAGHSGGCTWLAPSEPQRRALAVDVLAQPSGEQVSGWGPGIYLDADAIEAMGRALKNAPTPLPAAGTTFFRVGT